MQKVCPNCGSNTFEIIEHSHRHIFINGEGEFVVSVSDWYLDKHEYPAKCIDCEKEFETLSELVTETEYKLGGQYVYK